MISLIRGSDNFDSANTVGNLSWGGVTTLGLLGDANGSVKTEGDTMSGSSFDRAYSVDDDAYDTTFAALSGTWRVMGYGADGDRGTLCLRIS